MRAQKSILATRHAVAGLSVVAQIAALLFWTRWALSQHLISFHGLSWIVLVAIATIATTLIHECGHAVLAWCFEMGFLSFRAGSLHAVKREGKWNFKFHAAGLITPGGAVGAVPTHPAQPRWEEIVMIAAGPAANLLIGAAAIWAVLHDRWASYQQTWELVAYTGAFCLIGAALNLIPFLSVDGGYSDGARILQIVTRSPHDDFHRAIASVASTVITSRRYRDLDIAQIERAAMLFPHDFRGLHLLLCACQYYEECGQLPEASAALAAAQNIYDENAIDLPGPLHTVFVIGHAWLNRDATAARLWWDRFQTRQNEYPNVDSWLAKAALFWIEGRPQQAEEAWQQASSDAETLPQFGAFEFDRLLCTLLHEAFHQPPQAAVPAPAPRVAASPVQAPAPIAAAIPVLTQTPILDAIPAPNSILVIATAAAAAPTPILEATPPQPRVTVIAGPAAAPPLIPAPVPVAVAPPPGPTPIAAVSADAIDLLDGLATRIPVAAPTPVPALIPVLTPTQNPEAILVLASVPVITPAPAAALTLIPAAIPAPASVPLAAAISSPTLAITPAPVPVAAASAPSSIAPIEIAESAPAPPRPVEAIIPIGVAASAPASDQTEVLSARLSLLTKPLPQPAQIVPLVTTVIDPIAGSMTRIPVAALQTAPARITLTPASAAPVAIAPPKPNAPAIPAAFARRPRPAPLPPGTAPDPFLAFETSSAETSLLEAPAFESPQASETPVAASSVASQPDAAPLIIPDPPTITPALAPAQPAIARGPIAAFQAKPELADAIPPPEEPARYDPFDFIRAAAIENLNASAS